MRTSRREQRGAAAVVFAILCSVLFAFAALVVDLGSARDVRRQAQNAADASALAGANEFYSASSVSAGKAAAAAAVKALAQKNFGIVPTAWAGCTDSARPAGYTPIDGPCISIDNATAPARIRVHLPTTPVATPLATLLGISSVPVSATAEGAIDYGGGIVPCGLCVLGTGTTVMSGPSRVTVSNADVHFNGSLTQSGSSYISVTGGDIEYQGTLTDSSSGVNSPTAVHDTGPLMADPLAFLWNAGRLPPDWSSLQVKGSVSAGSTCTLGPGRYDSMTFANGCTLTAGLYVVTGPFKISGGNTVDATAGVTLYFTCGTSAAPRTCNTGETGGTLEASGGSELPINAPSSGPLKGLSIVYDQNNAGQLVLSGGSAAMGGTIYVPSGTFTYSGGSAATSWNSMVVVKEFTVSGGASINLAYSAAGNVDMPAGIYLSR